MNLPDHLPPDQNDRALARNVAVQHKADLALSLLNSIREGVVAQPVVTIALPASMLITALVTKAFPLPAFEIGLMGAMPFIGNFLQIAFVPFLVRWQPAKVVSLVAATLHMLSLLAIGIFMPWIPHATPGEAAKWLIGWFFFSSLFSAVSGVGWSMWVEEWVPPRLRGKYFGRRNQIVQLATVVFLLVSGWALSRWNYSIYVFQGVLLVSVFLRLFSLHWQWVSPTRPYRPAPPMPNSIGQQARIVWAAKSFLMFVAFGSVWFFAANVFGPFYTVFMFNRVNLSAWEVGAVTALAQVGGALSLPAWGKLLDRYGNKPVMVFSLVIWQVSNFAWCFITPANGYLLYPMWAWGGATGAGFILGLFTVGLRLIPPEAKSFAIGLNLAVGSLVAGIAPILGGWFLSHELARGVEPMRLYHFCFLAQPVIGLAGAFLLLRVKEPAASPLSMVVGAMRNIRTLSGVLGLGFFANYTFFKAQPKTGD